MQPINQAECDKLNYKDDVEMRQSLPKILQLDLYVIGKIWIEALRVVLVGAKLCKIPVVHAAKQEESPKKPPPMKYKELPLYTSPHYEYKDYIADKEKCPELNDKLIHKALLPYVSEYRKTAEEGICKACSAISKNVEDTSKVLASRKNDFKAHMRSPDNLQLRQGVVASGVLAGYLVGGGGGIPRRAFCTSLGALATGALCFPKETDMYFREVCYRSAKLAITVYNSTCGKEFALRERLPCKDDLPPPPPERKRLCPPDK